MTEDQPFPYSAAQSIVLPSALKQRLDHYNSEAPRTQVEPARPVLGWSVGVTAGPAQTWPVCFSLQAILAAEVSGFILGSGVVFPPPGFLLIPSLIPLLPPSP